MNTLIHISVLDNKTSAICTARNGCMWDKDTKDGINTILPFELPPLHPHCRSHIYGIYADENTPKAVYRGEDWIKERTLDELQEQFGKQAGQLLYNGDITLNQAIDRYGLKRLTLKQLRQKIPVHSVQSFEFDRQFKQLQIYAEKVREKTIGITEEQIKDIEYKYRDIVKNWKPWQLGTINKEIQAILNNDINSLTLTADSLVKQLLHHPEITANEYRKIIELVNNTQKAGLSNGNIVLFTQDDAKKWYQVVIKATEKENYCLSVFQSSEKYVNKKLKKIEKILINK